MTDRTPQVEAGLKKKRERASERRERKGGGKEGVQEQTVESVREPADPQ